MPARKNPPGAFITFRCQRPNPVRFRGEAWVGAGVFPSQEPLAPEGGAGATAPPASRCPGLAPRPPGFAGSWAGRRGNARAPARPPGLPSRPFLLLVPRTGPRLPFPGGPRAWRRPAGKLTRDSRSLPPAAPGFGPGAVASATAFELQAASRGLKLK